MNSYCTNTKKIRGFTLAHALIALAIILVLGGLYWIFGYSPPTATVGGGGTSTPAATQLKWVSKPDQFVKNTNSPPFVVDLERYNNMSSTWDPYGNQTALVGVAEPASVSIVSINGAAPGNPVSIPAGTPGASAGGTAVPTQTTGTGDITIILRGSEAADARFIVIYVRSASDVQTAEARFSVTE